MLRVIAAALMVSAACSGSSTGYGSSPPPAPPPPPPPAGGRSTTITVANNSFSPTPDTINAGAINFDWAAGAATHNVFWDTGPTSPANIPNSSSGTVARTLAQGTYTYHCSLHGSAGSGMSGVIVVLP